MAKEHSYYRDKLQSIKTAIDMLLAQMEQEITLKPNQKRKVEEDYPKYKRMLLLVPV